VAQARTANLSSRIIDRAHSDVGVEHLYKHGASPIIMGRREIAVAMPEETLPSPGPSPRAGCRTRAVKEDISSRARSNRSFCDYIYI
jgi:hypothetical protein